MMEAILLMTLSIRLKHTFGLSEKENTDNCNVNSASNVAHQSNNSTNTNGSVAYLNLNNDTSNTNANISSRLLPIGSIMYNCCKQVNIILPYLLVKNKE